MIQYYSESDLLKRFIREETPIRLTLTTGSKIIEKISNGVKYFVSDLRLNRSELQFIQKVKRHVKKITLPEGFKHRQYVHDYTQGSKKVKVINHIERMIEIDVNGAYWRTAYILGYIDEPLYMQGLEVNKKVRLVALGALASTKRTYEITGKKFEFIKETNNDETRNVFFEIADYFNKVMKKLMYELEEEFLFYWVDAFFVKDNLQTRVKVKEFFKRENYEVKEKRISSITSKQITKTLFCIYVVQPEGKKMIFDDDGNENNLNKIRIKPFLFNFKSEKDQSLIHTLNRNYLTAKKLLQNEKDNN